MVFFRVYAHISIETLIYAKLLFLFQECLYHVISRYTRFIFRSRTCIHAEAVGVK